MRSSLSVCVYLEERVRRVVTDEHGPPMQARRKRKRSASDLNGIAIEVCFHTIIFRLDHDTFYISLFFISEVILYVHLNPLHLHRCLLILRLHRDINWGMEVKMEAKFRRLSTKYVIQDQQSIISQIQAYGDGLGIVCMCWIVVVDEMFLYSQGKNLTATRLWIQFSTIIATKFDELYKLRLTIHFLIC